MKEEKTVPALRNALFANVVRQEFAFFDDPANSPFAISSRLADDTDLVAKAYGQPLSSLADVTFALGIAYTVALLASWRLVLVTIAVLPLMAYTARKQQGMQESSQRRAQRLIAEASTVAGDAGQDIGTVAAFNMQASVQSMYEGLVQERVGEGMKYALGVALTFMFQETGRYLNQFIVRQPPSRFRTLDPRPKGLENIYTVSGYHGIYTLWSCCWGRWTQGLKWRAQVYYYGSFLAAAGHMIGGDIIRADQSIMSATFR